MHRRLAIFFVALVTALFHVPATAQHLTKRVALVIGIEKYESLIPLNNPVLDARTMAELLTKQGFDVSAYYDLNRDSLEEALSDFSNKSEGAETVLMYYSGHGMEVVDKNDHFNVLAPVDAKIDCDTRKASRFVRVDELFRTIRGIANQVVFIDACRDIAFQRCPPKRGAADEGNGYGFRAFVPEVRAGEAILVTYSTGQKALARDGEPGKHSPFAKVLFDELQENPYTHFLPLINRTIVKVGRATNFKQVPSLSIEGGIPQTCLAGKGCQEGLEEDGETRLARTRTLGQLATKHMDTHEYVNAMLLALEGLDHEVKLRWPGGHVKASTNSNAAMDDFLRRSRRRGTSAEYSNVAPELPRILYDVTEKSRERAILPIDVDKFGRVIALSYDGTEAFIVSGKEPSYILNLSTGKVTATIDVSASGIWLSSLDGPDLRVSVIAEFSPDGGRLLTASGDQDARIWDTRTGESLTILHDGQGVESAAFSKDGALVVTSSKSGALHLWDAHTGKKLKTIDVGMGRFKKAALSPDATEASIISSGEPTVQIVEIKSGFVKNTLKGHQWSVNSAAFSPDGTHIVTASSDSTVRIWDAKTGEPRMILRGHRGTVAKAVYSSDGSRIISVDLEGATTRVWDANTGEDLAVLAGHLGRIRSVALNSESMLVTASSSDNTVRYWDVSERPERAVAEAVWGSDSYFSRPHWFQMDDALTGVARITLLEFAIATVPRCLTPGQREKFGLAAAPPQWCERLKKWPYVGGDEKSLRRR